MQEWLGLLYSGTAQQMCVFKAKARLFGKIKTVGFSTVEKQFNKLTIKQETKMKWKKYGTREKQAQPRDSILIPE